MKNPIKPYKNSYLAKKHQVEQMFDRISPNYDLINRILSLGIDVQWRKKLTRSLAKHSPNRILDVATGTGDLAILSAQKIPKAQIIGIDFSQGMLHLAREKVVEKKLDERIKMINSDSERIPFKKDYFDAVTVAFGIRNFEDISAGLLEMHRVLTPKGHLMILEFSTPTNSVIKMFYSLYSRYILPFIGSVLSNDKAAYVYLKESAAAFPYGKEMEGILLKAGFHHVQMIPLTFGIATIYIAKKEKHK